MKPDYRFPSQIKVDLSEIEKPLRRRKTEKYEPLSLIEIFAVAVFSGLSIGLVISIILLSV